MWLTALKEHGYGGRRIAKNQDYEVHSPRDVTILTAAKLAIIKKAAKSEPVKEVKKVEANKFWNDLTGGIVNEAPVLTRDEEPADDADDDIIEIEETSPPSTTTATRSRKQRRQYKRKDMVPE